MIGVGYLPFMYGLAYIMYVHLTVSTKTPL